MTFMIVSGSLAHGLHFLVGTAAEINLSSRLVGKLRHPSHKTFDGLSRASRGARRRRGETPMARPPSGKLHQRAEWWDFAGERMSGVWQLAHFTRASSCCCRDVDLAE